MGKQSTAAVAAVMCVVACLASLAVTNPRAELLQPRRFKSFDSETGAPAVLAQKPLTPKKMAWELHQLAVLHGEGILDDEDFSDAKSKIEAKARQSGDSVESPASPRPSASAPRPHSRMSPADLKRAHAVIAALNKVKKDHTYIKKQLKSPWRQDKKKLEEKDKLLADRMAKLEDMEDEMKKKFSQHRHTSSAQRSAEQDFAVPHLAAPSPRAAFGYPRSPAISSELQRALGMAPDYFTANVQVPSVGARTARDLGTDSVFMDPESTTH